MEDEEFPQEITAQEADLKFQKLLIDGIGSMWGSQIHPQPAPVVARILSPFDVLVKIYTLQREIAYSHRRYGYDTILDKRTPTQWFPIRSPFVDVTGTVLDRSIQSCESVLDGIVGVKFTFQPSA